MIYSYIVVDNLVNESAKSGLPPNCMMESVVRAEFDRISALNQLAAFALAINDETDSALSEQFGRTPSEIETLILVRHCETFTVGWLAEVLALTHSAAVRIVDRLQRDELINRVQQSNRRFVGLILTSKGIELADKILRARQETLESLACDVSDSSLEKALPLIKRILSKHSDHETVSYRRCRLCDEISCGTNCPVQNTFGTR